MVGSEQMRRSSSTVGGKMWTKGMKNSLTLTIKQFTNKAKSSSLTMGG